MDIELEIKCRMCGETHIVAAKEKDIVDWKNGMLIQDAMPYLSASDRELLISKTCNDCFHELFPQIPDDDDDLASLLKGSRSHRNTCLVCDNDITGIGAGYCIVCGYYNS